MTDDQNTNPYEQQPKTEPEQTLTPDQKATLDKMAAEFVNGLNSSQPNEQEQSKPQETEQFSQATASASDIQDLQQQLAKAKSQLEAMTAACQRALADLQNIKRRNEEEKASFISFANINLIKALLPDIENITRAINHEPKDQEWTNGATQVMQQILTDLEKNGLQKIPTVGETFNPQVHEALLTGPGPKDQVIAELEVGFTLNEKVVKRARVTVGTGE